MGDSYPVVANKSVFGDSHATNACDESVTRHRSTENERQYACENGEKAKKRKVAWKKTTRETTRAVYAVYAVYAVWPSPAGSQPRARASASHVSRISHAEALSAAVNDANASRTSERAS
jgi:hypothetical protein